MPKYLKAHSFGEIYKILEEFSGLSVALYEIANILKKYHPEFKKFGNGPTWGTRDIGADPENKMVEVEYYSWIGDSEETISIKIPASLLAIDDLDNLDEQVKFFCELLAT